MRASVLATYPTRNFCIRTYPLNAYSLGWVATLRVENPVSSTPLAGRLEFFLTAFVIFMKRSAAIIAMYVCATGLLAAAGSRAEAPRVEAPRVDAAVAKDGELMQSGTLPAASTKVTRRQIWMEVTAYCACTRCCGPNAHGITASGLPVTHNLGRFAAADSAVLPIGSTIEVPGYHDGQSIPVIDRGGAIKGNKLDVFFPTHEQAMKWGRRWVLVTIETPEQGWVDPV